MPGPIVDIDGYSKWRMTLALKEATPEEETFFQLELERMFDKCDAVRPVSNVQVNRQGSTLVAIFDFAGPIDPVQAPLLRSEVRTFRDRVELQANRELVWNPHEDGWRKLGVEDS
jgi:hypothetical protein